MDRYSRRSDEISNLDSHLFSRTSRTFSPLEPLSISPTIRTLFTRSVDLLRLVRPHDENQVPSGIRIGNVGARNFFFSRAREKSPPLFEWNMTRVHSRDSWARARAFLHQQKWQRARRDRATALNHSFVPSLHFRRPFCRPPISRLILYVHNATSPRGVGRTAKGRRGEQDRPL